MQLEEQNKTASIVVKSRNLNLKKNLVKQLTLTSGALSNLKAQAALVESGETAQSETETDVGGRLIFRKARHRNYRG